MTILGLVRCRTRFALGPWVLFCGILCAAAPSQASTIIETGAGPTGPAVNAGQFESQGWTQTNTYANAIISVDLLSWTPGATFDITAYLTNAIGPLATAPPLALTSFSGQTSDSNPETFVLFTDLTLVPGTYFLTLSSTDDGGGEAGALWSTECAFGCPVALDSGVTLLSEYFVNTSFGVEDPAYAPASTFMSSNAVLNFSLTDDGARSLSMPEPATLPAAMIGMAALLAALRLRNRNSSSTW
jgi:hypothetical protein